MNTQCSTNLLSTPERLKDRMALIRVEKHGLLGVGGSVQNPLQRARVHFFPLLKKVRAKYRSCPKGREKSVHRAHVHFFRTIKGSRANKSQCSEGKGVVGSVRHDRRNWSPRSRIRWRGSTGTMRLDSSLLVCVCVLECVLAVLRQ